MGKKGFTLLELTIVIIIIAVLLLFAFPQFLRAVERGRKGEANIIMDALKKAELTYDTTWDNFTNSMTWLQGEVPETVKTNNWTFSVTNTATTVNIIATRNGGSWPNNTMWVTGTRDANGVSWTRGAEKGYDF